ncbi:PREDICTED: uncharacterized protein LOC105545959 [Mandrillus leucophaeus]|uniref:uncharacterized protein LOC105545959 n=1 Tax=Mandrillus leucophaeus TaxID=9568 RepID=UPI0005F488A7|nr:PREDICTED: uncharacterized protein LOC105545959 [Mandrillus leucophaeus]
MPWLARPGCSERPSPSVTSPERSTPALSTRGCAPAAAGAEVWFFSFSSARGHGRPCSRRPGPIKGGCRTSRGRKRPVRRCGRSGTWQTDGPSADRWSASGCGGPGALNRPLLGGSQLQWRQREGAFRCSLAGRALDQRGPQVFLLAVLQLKSYIRSQFRFVTDVNKFLYPRLCYDLSAVCFDFFLRLRFWLLVVAEFNWHFYFTSNLVS